MSPFHLSQVNPKCIHHINENTNHGIILFYSESEAPKQLKNLPNCLNPITFSEVSGCPPVTLTTIL